MADYTGIHKFSVEYKYKEKFKKFFAENFDKHSQYYWSYNSRSTIKYEGNTKMLILYIETINEPGLMAEIEKLKYFPKVKYTKLLEKRLYEIAFRNQGIQEVLPSGRDTSYYSDISYKYLYYIANIRLVGHGLENKISLLKFVGEKEEYVTVESFKDDDTFDRESDANACVCIRATFDNKYNESLVSCKLKSIYIKEDI